MSEPVPQKTPAEAPAEAAPPFGDGLPVWSCSFSEMPKDKNWTVGAKRSMQCQGDYMEKLTDKAQIQFASEDIKHALKILEVQNSDHTSASFTVTAYRAGDFKKVPLLIKDSGSGFKVEALAWQVSTVIPKGAKPIPYGPNNPMQLSMPLWYWASFGFAGLVVVLLVFYKLRKWLQRRRLIEELASHSTALTPYNQFNKDMRQVARKYHKKVNNKEEELALAESYLSAVDETFKLYLTRELFVPALEWKTGAVISEIRKRHKSVYQGSGIEIGRLLRELRKANVAKNKLQIYDCDQLADMSRKVTGKIYQQRRK